MLWQVGMAPGCPSLQNSAVQLHEACIHKMQLQLKDTLRCCCSLPGCQGTPRASQALITYCTRPTSSPLLPVGLDHVVFNIEMCAGGKPCAQQAGKGCPERSKRFEAGQKRGRMSGQSLGWMRQILGEVAHT